jgi:hypothetical protein
MTPTQASFAAGTLGLLGFALLNSVVLRLPGRLAPVSRQALLALMVHGLSFALTAWLVPGVTYWHGAALYWCGFNCYLFAFCAVYKSVSLRVLTELARTQEQCLGLDAIARTYIQPCFTQRTALLVASGLAEEQEGKFSITARGRQLAARFAGVQRLFGIQRTTLYTLSRRLPAQTIGPD